MAARIVEACDAMIERWQSLLEAGDATTFDRVYLPDILDAEFQEALANLTGRHVYVMPVNYGQAELATRQADLNQHSPAVLVVERYTKPGTVPRDWLDDQVQWVEEQIYKPLQNLRMDPLMGDLWSHQATVATVYDVDFLRSHKLFWSEVNFEFREIS